MRNPNGAHEAEPCNRVLRILLSRGSGRGFEAAVKMDEEFTNDDSVPSDIGTRPDWIVRWQRQAELDQPAVQKLYRRRCSHSGRQYF
jgi:hypothetical protein